MKKILLAGKHKSDFALVDDEDFLALSRYKWYVVPGRATKYAAAKLPLAEGGQHVYMHRMILGLVRGDPRHTDHRDHNGLNNQRSNIWACTPKQNMANVIRQPRSERPKVITEPIKIPCKIGDHVSLEEVKEWHILAVLASVTTWEEAASILGVYPSSLWRIQKRSPRVAAMTGLPRRAVST